MKKIINKVTIEGYVYSFGNENGRQKLELKTVKDAKKETFGQEYITGIMNIAVDESGYNIIPVRFSYVTPKTRQDKDNLTFNALKTILSTPNATWIEGGKENALKVRCDTSLGLNDFYDSRDNRLVSSIIQENGFVTIINELSAEENRNTFQLDFLITGVTRVEADPSRNIPADYCNVMGGTFNYKNTYLPMTLTIKSPRGMEYFENLGASRAEPVFTKVFGCINSFTTKVEKKEESALGEEIVVSSYERKNKEWLIVNAIKEPYEFGDEKVLTVEELSKSVQDRETYLATVKKDAEDYQNSKNLSFSEPKAAATPVTPAKTNINYTF